jgi:arginine-tRNA-protein transferase
VNKPRPPALALYATPPQPCSYLHGRRATTIFVDPDAPREAGLYGRLSALGFRRSGQHLYRPGCEGCSACVPVRVEVARFAPRRCQRRTLRRNQDLLQRWEPAAFDGEHFELYRRYLRARHAGGGMDDPTPASFEGFLNAAWSETRFLELREPQSGRLLAVGVVDCMEEALSAVYTFFEPTEPGRSLGRLMVLLEIELAHALGLRWLYLGYWIRDCARMRYKIEYQPLDYFWGGRWQQDPPRQFRA